MTKNPAHWLLCMLLLAIVLERSTTDTDDWKPTDDFIESHVNGSNSSQIFIKPANRNEETKARESARKIYKLQEKRPATRLDINGRNGKTSENFRVEIAKIFFGNHHRTIQQKSLSNIYIQENHINKFLQSQQYRTKRAQKSTRNAETLSQHNFELPSVPLPTPPPFSMNFPMNSFLGAGQKASPASSHFLNAFAISGFSPKSSSASSSSTSSSASSSSECGGVFKSRHGVIKTPNFPHKFQTPIECVWIIDASELPTISASASSSSASASSGAANISIVVYLTQLYVLGGLKFTEYMYYSDDYKVPAHRVFTLTEDDVTQATWIQFHSQYLEIRFVMSTLDGTHLRALDRLLDVYGFNITYEVQDQVKPYQCNTLQCRFLGHCYAKEDFSSYFCDCFAGFSGTDCGRGPLCEDPHTNICQNGATCKHIGDAAITCHCPVGFKGTKCEIPEVNERTMGCTANSSSIDCHRECNFNRSSYESNSVAKSRKIAARTDKTRYEVTIRLGTNLTAFYRNADGERKSSDHLPGLLERQVMRVLRNFNITNISDLELLSNGTDRLDITFHFFGVKGDSNRIREAITRMVERGRIGNITLVSNYHIFDENPPLDLIELTVNQKSAIREGSEFILYCTAQGSSRMQFQWFKDGAIVNASKATREIWTTVLPPETKDVFTAILGVTKASRTDEGIYTCKVTDWGVEQCRSIHIHIKSPPRLRVDPASVTLQRGDSLRVRCLSPGNDDIKRYAQLGYSWTRNGNLFQSDPATVMWEDLYPDGSILKINNIQKSAEYTCIVSNAVKPVAKSVYITVIDQNAVHVCHAEALFGVHWPTSAPGAAILSDCPRGFEGHSRRICEKRNAANSSWLLPDFSLCIHDQLLMIYNQYHTLAAGFQQSNSSAILKACFNYTINRYKHFLPGEAGFLIDMLHEVDSYLQLKGTQLEREMAAEIILHILDKVMQNPQSLNSQQQIKKLQLLTQSAALNRETIAASQLATSTSSSSSSLADSILQPPNNELQDATSSTSDSLSTQMTTTSNRQPAAAATSTLLKSVVVADGRNVGSGTLTVDEESLSLDRLTSLRIYMTSVRTLPFNLRIYGNDLFSDQLYMDIGLTPRLLNIMANSTIFASVISYKNLKSFLPKTYFTRGSDPKDTDYILASRIIQTWLFQSNRSNDNLREPLDLPFEAGHVEIIFQHESPPKDSDWVAVCGHDYKASFESTWRSDLCITKHLMENITRCICPLSGTYVVILTKKPPNHSALEHPATSPIFITISCSCCLLQTCSAFLILLPIWFNRKCAITFLKMQFCISTSSIMIIFLLGFLKMLPVHWQAVISSSLASLLLLGISTLIAIALVIHTELVPKKYLHMNKSMGNPRPAAITAVSTTLPRKGPTSLLAQQPKRRNSLNAGICVSGGSEGSLSGLTNITQISGSSNMSPNNSTNKKASLMTIPTTATTTSTSTMTPTPLSVSTASMPAYQLPPSGVCAAIGISWLLPFLFAIASPLVCTIIGKWPRNWWLEIMSGTTMPSNAFNDVNVDGENHFGSDGGGGLGYFHSGYVPTKQDTKASFITSNNSYESIQNNSIASSPAIADPIISASTTVTGTAMATATATAIASTSMLPLSTHISSDDSMHINSSETIPSTKSSSSPQLPWRSSHPLTYGGEYSNIANAQYQPINGIYADSYNNKTPSLSFVTFICVDLLFVLLFVALFVILIKKLLWLWHNNEQKNRSTSTFRGGIASGGSSGSGSASGGGSISVAQQLHHHHHHQHQHHHQHHRHHPLDKLSVAMRRRIGLLYRTGCLLVTKLCTDYLFIAYTNISEEENTYLGYPFGVSCIVLGTTILYCFIIKPECSLRDQGSGLMSNNSKTSTLKKKFSSSKTSLDDNYGTAAINSPLSFYTSHEKEKESESCAPPHLSALMANAPPSMVPSQPPSSSQKIDMTSCSQAKNVGGVQLPLTIISTAPARCQLLTATGLHELTTSAGSAGNVETILGAMPPHLAAVPPSASRCCSLIGNMIGGTPTSVQSASNTVGYYDAFTLSGLPIPMTTGSLSRQQRLATHHQIQHQQQQQVQDQQHLEFVGVEALDILQGVAPDTIIGIRTSNMLPATSSTVYQQHHKPFAENSNFHAAPTMSIMTAVNYTNDPSINSPNPISNNSTTTTSTAITTNSVMTQTPKSQKRVTIMEPTTHTFDPMLPTMAAVSGVPTTATSQLLATSICATPTPIITITATTTSTDDKANKASKLDIKNTEINSDTDNSSNDGSVFDRITSDLDYLLNRSNDIPNANNDANDGVVDDVGADSVSAGHCMQTQLAAPPLLPSVSICIPTTNAINTPSPTCSDNSTKSPSASALLASSSCSSSSIVTNRSKAQAQHAIILEETEAEL